MKKKNIISICITLLIVIGIITSGLVTSAINIESSNPNIKSTTSEDYIPSEKPIIITHYIKVFQELKPKQLNFIDTNDLVELQSLMTDCLDRMTASHTMAEAARNLGYSEENAVIQLAKKEWQQASNLYQEYLLRYKEELIKQEQANKQEQLLSAVAFNEYPVAAQIWSYLKNQNMSDYICAGILGNLMAEVGGNTLDIQYQLDTGNGYVGMCQWSKYYYNLPDLSLEGQCNFLMDTIKNEFDNFGYNYYSGFNYNAFLQLNNERDAAIAFAKCYERCGSNYVKHRANLATIAYNYFVQ